MSLIAHYKLDGDTRDNAGNNHGTSSSIAYADGKLGQGANMLGASASLPITVNYTYSISFWLKLKTGYTGSYRKFLQHSTNRSPGFWFGSTGNFLHMRQVCEGNSNSGLNSSPIDLNKWIHVVFICNASIDSNTYFSNYINGEIDSSYTEGSHPIITGSSIDLLSQDYEIDDVRIYDHALSLREVKELAKAKVLHYKFDNFVEPTENVIPDGNFSQKTFQNPYPLASGGTISFVDLPAPTSSVALKHEATGDDSYTSGYSSSLSPASAGEKWTVSVYARGASGGESMSFFIFGYNSGILDYSSKTFTLTAGWERYSFTWTFTDANVTGVTTRLDNNISGDIIYFNGWQLEKKDHATPFVNGTRTYGTIRDCSGQGNDGEVALATTPEWTRDAKIGGGAYRFDGATTKIDLNSFSINDNKITMSAWVYTKSLSKTSAIIRKQNAFILQTNTSGVFRPHIHNGTSWFIAESPANTIVLNKWQYLSAVYDGVNLIGYIDGIEVCRQSATGSLVYNTNTTSIGYHATTEWHDGIIDDVRVYATALSEEDIKRLYQTRASLDDKGNLYLSQVRSLPIPETQTGETLSFDKTFNDYVDEIKVEGNTIQEGAPSPGNPIEIKSSNGEIVSIGPNLFDYGGGVISGLDKSSSQEYISINMTEFCKRHLGQIFTVSFDVKSEIPGSLSVYSLGWSKAVTRKTVNATNEYTRVSVKLTADNSVIDPNGDWVAFSVYGTYGSGKIPSIKNVIVTMGFEDTVFDYIPYIEPSILTINNLNKIGDVADTYNPITGEHIQRIGVKVFDGTESFSIDTNWYYCTSMGSGYINIPLSKCTHCLCVVKNSLDPINTFHLTNSGAGYFEFSKYTFSTITDLKDYLTNQYTAGTPVTVYYQLATPIISYLEPQQIPTFYPTTIIESDSEVKPTITATVSTTVKRRNL